MADGMAGASSYDVDAQLYFDQVVINGGAEFTTPTKDYWNTIFIALKASGTFQKLDRLFAFSNETSIAARTSLARPTTSLMADPINSPVFTAWSGYQTDGATNYVTPNCNLAGSTIYYALDDSTWGLGYTGRVGDGFSGVVSGSDVFISPSYVGTQYYDINSLTYDSTAVAGSLSADYAVIRTNAANFSWYKNNVATLKVSVSTSVPAVDIPTLGGRTDSPTVVAFFENELLKWHAVGSAINFSQFRTDFTTQLL